MKKQYILPLLFLLLGTLFTACKKENVCSDPIGVSVNRTFDLTDFTAIRLDNNAKVHLVEGATETISASGDSLFIEQLELSVSSNELKIKFTEYCSNSAAIDIYITMPTFNKIEVRGAGSVETDSFSNVRELETVMNGSGSIELGHISKLNTLNATINGSGTVLAKTKIENIDKVNVQVNGSGSLDIYKVKADSCTATISGSGFARMFVKDLLKVNISGSGSFYYLGQPTIDSEISGSGKVEEAM